MFLIHYNKHLIFNLLFCLYIFVLHLFCVFNDAASNSDYEVSNDMINEWLSGKDVTENGHGYLEVL